MFATFRNAVLLGSVLALPMIGLVSTSARATAVASASTSISDFDFGFAPTTTQVSSVSTAVNLSGSVGDTSITPTNSLGILVTGGSGGSASFFGATTLDFNTGTFQWRLPPVNVQADATAETGSNITAHSTAILDQDIFFTSICSTRLQHGHAA